MYKKKKEKKKEKIKDKAVGLFILKQIKKFDCAKSHEKKLSNKTHTHTPQTISPLTGLK